MIMHWAYRIIYILTLILLAKGNGSRRGGAPFSAALKPPSLAKADRLHSKTTHSCEGNELNVDCDEGKVIRLIRANYGRFSISMCNDDGHVDWRVNCMSYKSFLIMQDRCSQKQNCGIRVSSSIFGDPCPGTLKYLEVQYQCVSPSFFTSTTRKSAILGNNSAPGDIDLAPPDTTVSAVLETSSEISEIAPITSPSSSSSTTSTTTTATTSVKYPQENFSLVTSTAKSTTEMPTTSPKTTSIPTIPPNHCPPVLMSDIQWNWTKAGTQAIHRCPGGATGLARWQCASDPVRWLTPYPDLKECRSGWVVSLKKRMENGESINNVATELALMTYIKPLYADDLKDIAEVIQQTLSRAINGMDNFHDLWHRYHVLRELLQSLVETISNLLKDGQNAWNDLPINDRRRVTSSLLDGLEESAMLLAHSSGIEDSFTLAEANILLSVQVVNARTTNAVQFPVINDFRGETGETAWIRMDDTLVLPAQTLLDVSKHGLAKVVFVVYSGIGNLLKPEPGYSFRSGKGNSSWRINSKVIAASIGKPGMTRLSQPVIVTFRHLEEENMTNPMCVFWDFDTREWSNAGCWVQSTNATHTSCACNHLTNFAVVMEVTDVKEVPVPQDILHVTITVGCVICIICLIVTIIPIFLLRSLNGDAVTVHRNIFVCLLLTEIVLVAGVEQTWEPILCAILAAVLDYLLLATICWAFLECFQLYVELADISQPQKSRWAWYYGLAYCVPAVIVSIAAIVDCKSLGTERLCWLRSDNFFIFSFIGPAVGIYFGGMVFLCVASCILCHHSSITTTIKGKEEAKLSKIKIHIRRAVLLMLILGLTWTTGLLYLHQETIGLAYTFTVLNSCQGIFILIFYCITDEKIQPELERLGDCRFLGSLNRSKGNLPPPAALSPGSPGQHSEVCQDIESPHKQGNCSVNLTSTTLGPLYTTSISSPIQENHTAEIAKVPQQVYGLQKAAEVYSQNNGPGINHQESPCKVWLPYEWQRRLDRQYLGTGDLYGPFTEHIYESVDGDYGYSGHPRSLAGEYCYRSDVSQHSSSSYGYDQRPLLILPRHPGHGDYGTGRRHSPDKHRRRHRNHRRSVDDTKADNISTVVVEQDHIQNDIERGGNQVQQQQQPPTTEENEWNLPDLLRCPVDNTVVMAVLDGEKVVSRVQPECPHYNLSTYC
ncbi:latrophilin Cirl isoform X2 [Parasteatoda tepidariorum]|uniref:latrophilin Cirl isoform X2 n=2 Tax=Parasteatoda tepidariorum TaxID=114398 RepID=UPI001C71F0B8|nr:adhesion G protein-coupled receptor L1 isoform X2 [Parasteatoda tepidariorum]